MIAEMRRAGMAFGYHTRSHKMLSRLSPAEQDEELRDGVRLDSRAHRPGARVVLLPVGRPRHLHPRLARLLARPGYSVAFNTVRRRIAGGADHRYELPRLDTRDLPPYTGRAGVAGGARRSASDEA